MPQEFEQEQYQPHARKKKKGRFGCLIVIVLFAVLLIAAGLLGTRFMNEVYGSDTKGSEVTVHIDQGSGPLTIGRALQEAGVIQTPKLFQLYVRYTESAGQLQYGDFTLCAGMSYDEIIEALSVTVKRDTVTITFPEGITALRFAQLMEENGLCTAEEFLDVANNGDFSQYDFWNQIPEDDTIFMKCEGYLFPNTYEFYADDEVYNYVNTFYAEFDRQVTADLRARAEEEGMTLHEAITLASFVQEEAGNDQNAKVSAVFHNRLAEGSPYPRLESNVSSYVQREDDNNYLYNWVAPYYGGWDNIPAEIYAAYNTYEHEGLTPGPVSNPGIEAIKAALYPDEQYIADGYYFFVTDKNGKYYYGKTPAEHQANVKTAFSVQ